MFKKKQIQQDRAAEYTTKDDLCRVFAEHKSSLYLLSLLLTGNSKQAEECFVAGLEDAVEGMPVFKDWAQKWARVMIIQNAHRMIKPQIGQSQESKSEPVAYGLDDGTSEHPELTAVATLQPFERFVFVLSVLERYTDQYCAVFLGCSRRDVTEARTRALQQIGDAVPSSLESMLPASA